MSDLDVPNQMNKQIWNAAFARLTTKLDKIKCLLEQKRIFTGDSLFKNPFGLSSPLCIGAGSIYALAPMLLIRAERETRNWDIRMMETYGSADQPLYTQYSRVCAKAIYKLDQPNGIPYFRSGFLTRHVNCFFLRSFKHVNSSISLQVRHLSSILVEIDPSQGLTIIKVAIKTGSVCFSRSFSLQERFTFLDLRVLVEGNASISSDDVVDICTEPGNDCGEDMAGVGAWIALFLGGREKCCSTMPLNDELEYEALASNQAIGFDFINDFTDFSRLCHLSEFSQSLENAREPLLYDDTFPSNRQAYLESLQGEFRFEESGHLCYVTPPSRRFLIRANEENFPGVLSCRSNVDASNNYAVLMTPRSGSTAFTEHLSSIGLGAPTEFMVPFHYIPFASMRCQTNSGNYHNFIRDCFRNPKNGLSGIQIDPDRLQPTYSMLTKSTSRFIIFLRRDVLAQALSLSLSVHCNLWFDYSAHEYHLALESLSLEQFEAELYRVVNWNLYLLAFLRIHSSESMLIFGEDYFSEPERGLKNIAHFLGCASSDVLPWRPNAEFSTSRVAGIDNVQVSEKLARFMRELSINSLQDILDLAACGRSKHPLEPSSFGNPISLSSALDEKHSIEMFLRFFSCKKYFDQQ